MTLGMSKRKISFILLIETFIIGIISLLIGLALGIVISQITSIFVANMFEANMSRFTFNFSKTAMLKTILYFVMIFNTIMVSKNKLINLLQASRKSENVKIKNPIICIIIFIISTICLGSAYYSVTIGIEDLLNHDIYILLVPIILGTVGTLLFFYSLSGMILKILSKWTKVYYKKLNTFIFKQINSKINTMIISISMICIMLFVTLCLLSSALTVKNYFNNSLAKNTPMDIQIAGDYNEENSEVNLVNYIKSDKIIKNNVKDITVIEIYYDENFNYGKSLGNYESVIKDKYPFLKYDARIEIISLSDYNKLAKMYNLESINLDDDMYAIVSNYEKEIYEEVIKRENIMNIYDKQLKPFNKVINGTIFMATNNMGFFVVNDNIVNTNNKYEQVLYCNYKTKDEKLIEKIEKKLEDYDSSQNIVIDTKLEIETAAATLSAVVTFIGLYLGIIFLISSSAILALKSLSDSIDDKNKYKILRQIGTDEKEINKALFKQTFIFFMMPLLLAIIHTLVGLKFCSYMLNSLGITDVSSGFIRTFIFLIAIYGIYFLVTYLCSKNIIKERV